MGLIWKQEENEVNTWNAFWSTKKPRDGTRHPHAIGRDFEIGNSSERFRNGTLISFTATNVRDTHDSICDLEECFADVSNLLIVVAHAFGDEFPDLGSRW